MDFRRGRKHEELEINLVPLIDVLLVIIIFLVVSATFSRINELQINLPTAEANAPQEKDQKIEISVDPSGHYTVNRVSLADSTVDGIVLAMRKAAGSSKEPTIIISADAKAMHQSVVNVMEAARIAGYTHITFSTLVE